MTLPFWPKAWARDPDTKLWSYDAAKDMTGAQFNNLCYHVYWRDLVWYARWVDKHG